MLNKEVCKRCCNIAAINKSLEWNIDDENWWKDGVVHCSENFTSQEVKVNEDPPDFCPYVLEHEVSR